MPEGTSEIEVGQAERATAWARAIVRLLQCANEHDEWVRDYLIHEATWFVPLKVKQPAAHRFRYVSEQVRAMPRGSSAFEREHVRPRSRVEAEVRAATTEDEISRILSASIVCAVTEQEHARLNDRLDGWDRYRHAGVRVWDSKGRRWLW